MAFAVLDNETALYISDNFGGNVDYCIRFVWRC
jgi:hypothetical protein